MKKVLRALLVVLPLSICANAQLRVTNGGNVVVGSEIANSGAQLTSYKVGTDTVIGLLGIAKSYNFSYTSAGAIYPSQLLGKSFGVRGVAGGGDGPYNYGVCGQLQPGSPGAAVAGFVNNSPLAPGTSRYAGLFNGAVKIVGVATATSFSTSSDLRLKKEISEINLEAIQNISQLNPVQYYWDSKQYAKCVYGHEEEMEGILDDKLHYGFIAQELRESFPNLVYGNEEEGTLSVNYIELIPLLVQSIQELSREVQELRGLEVRKSPAVGDKLGSELPAVLYQNNPNPFSQSTTIRYQLPQTIQTACIFVYDMSGNQLNSYPISDRGEGQLTISASEYQAGMYLYSLIADGQEIDTKRMILTK